MSVRISRIVGPVQIANAATSYFTASFSTRLDKVTISNPDAATSYSFDLYVVPQGSAADAAHDMVPTTFLQALESRDITQLIGHVLNAGDQLFAIASVAAKLNLLISGTLVS